MTVAAAERLLWWHAAACKDVDPDLFHPARGESTSAAKAVCATCAVRRECLDWALRNVERFGIWGGMSERERRRLRSTVGPRTMVRICACCGDTYWPRRSDQRFCTPDCRKFHTTRCLSGGHAHAEELVCLGLLVLFIVVGLRLVGLGL